MIRPRPVESVPGRCLAEFDSGLALLAVVLLLVCRGAPAWSEIVRSGPTAPNEFEMRYDYAEGDRVLDRRDGSVLLSHEVLFDVVLRWQRLENAERPTFVGHIAEGVLRFRDTTLSAGVREHEIPLEGLVIRVHPGPSRVAAALDPDHWERVVTSWQRDSAGRLPASQMIVLTQRGRSVIREACKIPFLLALHGEGRELPVRLKFPLFGPDGKRAAGLTLEPENRRVVGDADLGVFQVPLRSFLTTSPQQDPSRLTTLRQPFESRRRLPAPETIPLGEVGFLRWSPRADRLPLSRVSCRSLSEHDVLDVLGSAARLLPPTRQEHEVVFDYGPPASFVVDGDDLTLRFPPPLPFRDWLAAAAPELDARIDALADGKEEAATVVKSYARIERTSRFSHRQRGLFHYVLAEELAVLASRPLDSGVKNTLERYLREETFPPVFVLALRAISHPYALLRDEERVSLLQIALGRLEPELARWGALFLSRTNWRGAPGALARRRRDLPAGHALIPWLDLACVRLLGAGYGGYEDRAPEDLARLARDVVPFAFSYLVRRRPGAASERVLAPALDALGLRHVVWALDSSPAMLEPLPAAQALVPGQGIGTVEALRRLSRLDWAREEIAVVLRGLGSHLSFGLIAFNARSFPWQTKLRPVDPRSVKSASSFLERLTPGTPGSVAVTLPTLVRYGQLDAVVVVSGDESAPRMEVQRAFVLWNYLRGVPVITVGFQSPSAVEPTTLQWLSRANWGWHVTVAAR